MTALGLEHLFESSSQIVIDDNSSMLLNDFDDQF